MRPSYFLLIIAIILFSPALSIADSTGVATGNLRLRSGPSTSHSIHGLVPSGTSLKILGEDQGFYHVQYQGKVGYVSGQFVKIKKAMTFFEAVKFWFMVIGGGAYFIFSFVVGRKLVNMKYDNGGYRRHTNDAMGDLAHEGMRQFAFEIQAAAFAIAVGAVCGPFYLAYHLVVRKMNSNKTIAE